MKYDQERIDVLGPQQFIYVGMESYACEFTMPAGIREIKWYPEGVSDTDKRCGVKIPVEGKPIVFKEFRELRPFIEAFTAKKFEAEKAAAERKATAEKEAAEIKAAQERQAAIAESMAPYIAAVRELEATDHEILKLAEEKLGGLVDDGELTIAQVEIINRRQAARSIAKAEKTRLKKEGLL